MLSIPAISIRKLIRLYKYHAFKIEAKAYCAILSEAKLKGISVKQIRRVPPREYEAEFCACQRRQRQYRNHSYHLHREEQDTHPSAANRLILQKRTQTKMKSSNSAPAPIPHAIAKYSNSSSISWKVEQLALDLQLIAWALLMSTLN